jgi:ectoine hydroxylase-related dioxygenase (phytanoyl-CoA dioxygenase family)
MPLTTEQISAFWKEGYVTVPGLFSSDEVQRISMLANEIAADTQQFKAPTTGQTFEKLQGSQIVLSVNNSVQAINRVVWAAAAKPELLTYGRDNKILAPVSQLLESDSADHLINQLHYKMPGDGVSFPWHQDEQNRRRFDNDWQDINAKGSFVQTLMAIDPCNADNGPLNVIPGSHHWGYLEFGNFLQTDSLQSLLTSKNISVDVNAAQIPILMSPGDVMFMHPLVVHGSWPNNSNQSRLMFINGFSYPGANQKPYPGDGSAKRISLKTGLELSPSDKTKSIATSTYSILSLAKVEEKPITLDSREAPRLG